MEDDDVQKGDDDVEDDEAEDDDVEEDEEEDDDEEDEDEDDDVEDDDEKDDNVVEDEVEEDDVAEDEVEDAEVRGDEDDDVENDDVEEEDNDDVGMLMLRVRTDPKTEDHTMCEPAQSKYMSTFHNQTRMSPERGHTFYANLRSRNACQDFTRATLLCGNLPEKCRTPEWAQNADTFFCASLRSRNACQDFTRAILCGNLQEKCRAPEWAQNAETLFVRACAVETHVKISQEPLYAEKILCEPARLKRMSWFHKSDFMRKIAGKMPRPRTTAQTLCEPARLKRMSRFHKSHLTLCGTLRGNLQEKCRCPDWAPWSSTGLDTYRKNPSVWTCCLGNKKKEASGAWQMSDQIHRDSLLIWVCPETRRAPRPQFQCEENIATIINYSGLGFFPLIARNFK